MRVTPWFVFDTGVRTDVNLEVEADAEDADAEGGMPFCTSRSTLSSLMGTSTTACTRLSRSDWRFATLATPDGPREWVVCTVVRRAFARFSEVGVGRALGSCRVCNVLDGAFDLIDADVDASKSLVFECLMIGVACVVEFDV